MKFRSCLIVIELFEAVKLPVWELAIRLKALLLWSKTAAHLSIKCEAQAECMSKCKNAFCINHTPCCATSMHHECSHMHWLFAYICCP